MEMWSDATVTQYVYSTSTNKYRRCDMNCKKYRTYVKLKFLTRTLENGARTHTHTHTHGMSTVVTPRAHARRALISTIHIGGLAGK